MTSSFVKTEIGEVAIPRKDQIELMKICLKRIKRKDAIAAITSLVGKNTTEAKQISDLLTTEDVYANLFLDSLI